MRLPVDTRAEADDGPAAAEPISSQVVVDGNGLATHTLRAVPQGYRWLIDYITVTVVSSATASPQAVVYVDSVDARNVLDGTSDATGAVAAYAPPRAISQGSQLVVIFSGAAPGAVTTVRVEYRQEAT